MTPPAQSATSSINPCPWLCAAPTGPDTPFEWPVFLVVDTLRLLMTAAAVALIAVSAWAIRRSQTQGQKTRFAFSACLCVVIAGTELTHLGDWPHWRFVVSLVGLALGLWGYYRHLRRELPARNKLDLSDGGGP